MRSREGEGRCVEADGRNFFHLLTRERVEERETEGDAKRDNFTQIFFSIA